jgi:hypothetical protein
MKSASSANLLTARTARSMSMLRFNQEQEEEILVSREQNKVYM